MASLYSKMRLEKRTTATFCYEYFRRRWRRRSAVCKSNGSRAWIARSRSGTRSTDRSRVRLSRNRNDALIVVVRTYRGSVVIRGHDEVEKSTPGMCARRSDRRRGSTRCSTSLRRHLRADWAPGAGLRTGSVRTGPRLLLGAGILDLERIPVRVGSRPLLLPALLRRGMASRTLGARSVRLVLAARTLGASVLIG